MIAFVTDMGRVAVAAIVLAVVFEAGSWVSMYLALRDR